MGRGKTIAVAALAACIAVSCGGDDGSSTESAAETTGAPTTSVDAPGGTAPAADPSAPPERDVVPGEDSAFRPSARIRDVLAAALGPTAGVPVFDGDFADPFLLLDRAYYLYSTNTAGSNLPVIRSVSGVQGQQLDDGFPVLPAWVEPGYTWAPSVLAVEDGYVLYYTARHRASGRQCIGVAVADRPEGPFVDEVGAPLICPLSLGGAIDASPFVDTDGTAYLYWKSDGNCCGITTELFGSRLSGDGERLEGPTVSLAHTSEGWEGPLIEGPSMVEADGRYVLFYSANRYDTPSYAVGFARCEGPLGPCTKPPGGPWLSRHGDARGPGGQEFFLDRRGNRWMLYHAWVTDQTGYQNGGARALFMQEVGFDADGVPVAGDGDPQAET